MIERTILTIQNLSWPIKIGSIILAFLAPLAGLIHVIIGLLLVDMVTSIYYQMKIAAEKAEKGKRTSTALRVIESGKLRKTIEKMFFYVLVIVVFYSFDLYVLQIKPISSDAIYSFSITNLSAVLISVVEMTSIAANVSKITGNPIFDRIMNLFAKKVNKKFDIEEE
jgi:hypothetical protein